jgi:DNA-binding GntR family transcriptional regulator
MVAAPRIAVARATAAPAERGAGEARAKPNSLVAKAYEEIKEKIITLYFLPGQYLNEAAISGLLQVGRTPVHQALQRLELEGLVEIMPRKGVVVLPDSISEIIKILESRAAVEAELAKAAAGHISADDGKELLALANATRHLKNGPGIDEFIACDRAFHRKLAEHSGNSVLRDFASSFTSGRSATGICICGRPWTCRPPPASTPRSPMPLPGTMASAPLPPCASTSTASRAD